MVLRIAYQGEPGAYSEQAAIDFFGHELEDVELVPCATFKSVCELLCNNEVHTAALPIENSLAGTIHGNLDLILSHHDIHIVSELDYHVRHCLLACKGVTINDIKVVRSHAMALGQCQNFLQQNKLTPEVAYDTAGAAKRIAKEQATDCAAIASRRAADIYNLEVLQDCIEDVAVENYTRFWILSTSPNTVDDYIPTLPTKTSIAFTLNNHAGSLSRALAVFGIHNIDLTKIESRHIRTLINALGNINEKQAHRWGYIFYVDFCGSITQKEVAVALENLKLLAPFYRLLGSYSSHGHMLESD